MTDAANELMTELPSDAQERLTPCRPTPPKPVRDDEWTVDDLREHLQFAVDVEHYTIPYYMAAWFSIKDQAAEAARLIKTVVNQEMLHLQCAANLLNAFGGTVTLCPPVYGGLIPHLDFALDDPDPTTRFSPWSTEIGPFDTRRLNTMCIIEFPEWTEPDTGSQDHGGEQYGSIGELYHAVARQVAHFGDDLQPGRNQVDLFSRFYPRVQLTVDGEGAVGLQEAKVLIDIIVEQGEGQSKSDDGVPIDYQNVVDDPQPAFDHFDKFTYLLGQPMPEVWDPHPEPSGRGRQAQRNLLLQYAQLLDRMEDLFRGGTADGFATAMFGVGGAIAQCWQRGAVPMFSLPADA